jgi:PAS domain S-box-containing protein
MDMAGISENGRRSAIDEELAPVLSAIPVYLWSAEIDPAGRLAYRFYTAAVEQITGRPAEFFLEGPHRWLSTVHPDDRPHFQRALERIRARQSDYEEAEYRVVHPGGAIRWVSDRVVVVRSPEGAARLHGVVWDVTDRRSTESALRDTESRYRLLFEESPAALWEEDRSEIRAHLDRWRASGVDDVRRYLDAHPEVLGEWAASVKIVDANPAALRLFEASGRQEMQLVWPRLVEAGALEPFREGVIALAEGRASFEADVAAVTFRGRRKTLAVQLSVPAAHRFTLSRILVSAREKEVEERLAIVAHLFEQSAVGVAFVDLTTCAIRLANSAFATMHGYTMEELVGKPILELCAPDEQPRITQYIRLVVAKRRFAFEAHHRRRDGTEFPVFVDVSVAQSAGRGSFLVASLLDLSERRRADEACARLAAIVTYSDDAIIGETSEGIIQTWNRAAERLYGYDAAEVIGKSAELFVPSNYREERERRLARVRQGEAVVMEETVHRRRDGTDIDVSMTISPIRDAAGNVIGLSKIVRDVTPAKREERLVRASLREKELMLQEIHHRVKNNLQVISSILFLEGRQLNDPRLDAVLTEANHRIQSIALVHERLYRSADMASVDFDEFLRNLFRFLLRTYGVEPDRITLRLDAGQVRLSVDDAVPCALIADELISNCLKHAFPGGRRGHIDVALRQVNGRRYLLEVCDDGVGLPPGLDFRNPPTLGLRLVGSLASQLGGDLQVARNRGACIQVRFNRPR